MKTKWLLLLFIGVPFFVVAQGKKIPYPKDTIFVFFDGVKDKKIKNWDYQGEKGVYFSLNDKSGQHISVFYPFSNRPIPCIQKL